MWNRVTAKVCALVIGFGAAVACSGTAQAVPITFTETGILTFSIGGTTYTNASVTFSTLTDTTALTTITVGGQTVYVAAGTTTVTAAGVGSATIIGSDSFGAFYQDLSSTQPGQVVAGIADITTQTPIFGNYAPTPPNYDLPLILTGAALSTANLVIPTSAGDVTIGGTSGQATFTGTLVPEPASLGLLAVGGIAGLLMRRRKQS